METNRPHSLAVALPILLGLLLYAPAFFGEAAYSYVLGVDQLATEGISWTSPVGGLLQTALDTFAYLHPTGLRLMGLVLVAAAVAALAAGLGRIGTHAAGAGLAAAMVFTHPATMAAVMKLDNSGLAAAIVLLALAATGAARRAGLAGAALLLAPALAHPIGLCAWPLAWLCARDEAERTTLRSPIMLALFLLPLIAWVAMTPMDLPHLLALAGQTWMNLFGGWRIGSYLPWAPEIAQGRLDLPGATTTLTAMWFVFTGAVALLARFGSALAESAQRLLPLAMVAPLLAGLAPMVTPIHGDPAYAIPLLMGLAILIGQAVGDAARRALNEDNLVGALVPTVVATLLTAGVFFATGADQVRIFKDGQVFWKVQRGRHEAAPQSRLGYARATLFWASDPRQMRGEGVKVELQPALRAAEILDNLFNDLEDGASLPDDQEAEAHWMYSVAVTPHFANEFRSAIAHLEAAVRLQPNSAFYAEALDRAQRDQAAYDGVITGCLTADQEQLEARRSTLMKQAESLAKAGLIDATIEKYRDAVRCAPAHRDGYQYLSRALASVGRHDDAIKVLEGTPPALAHDATLTEQKAFIVQNLPAKEGASAQERTRWRAEQRQKAHQIWLDIARRAPQRPMAWLNLAENAMSDGSGAAMAKAYLLKATTDRPELSANGRVRRLRDRIDRELKPDTPLPEIHFEKAAQDAGPAGDAVIDAGAP